MNRPYKKALLSITDVNNPKSISNRMRQKRFDLFSKLTESIPRPISIIDIGGTTAFWEQRGWAGRDDVLITTINIEAEPQQYDNIVPKSGDATDLSEYDESSFDVAFSNSVIEHLFTFANQQAMAKQVQRVAKAYWVQTPNYWFPVEPHFQYLGWQWLPLNKRIQIIRRRQCGRRGPIEDPVQARRLIEEVRLMTRKELNKIFPTAVIVPERVFGLVKSWIVQAGFDCQR